jgi:hypothetical protein
MNSFKKKGDWGEVSDLDMREYLLTWLAVCGKDVVSVDKAVEVDNLLDDEEEVHWSIAIDESFIEIIERRKLFKLTERAINYIIKEQHHA